MSFLIRIIAALTAALLTACGGDKGVAPDGLYVTLSVSASDITVETSINDKKDAFFSGGASGNMTAGGPINAQIKEGENDIAFSLTRAASLDNAFDPWLLASLEILFREEVVDTLAPGDRVIFTRELSDNEAAALEAGETVVVTEKLTITRERLDAIMAAGR